MKVKGDYFYFESDDIFEWLDDDDFSKIIELGFQIGKCSYEYISFINIDESDNNEVVFFGPYDYTFEYSKDRKEDTLKMEEILIKMSIEAEKEILRNS